ncbi:CocE/NonD family hydrolase [Actinoplanes solisilvae]|uniref:CocE/NonD family hydrolase n=1 Tax=Actinoplanes solisilvae TaxID=2486853 RepID=UPI000FDC34BF|nr:CocE/NonD family hydrolase [Actinoplanes solisilvae]
MTTIETTPQTAHDQRELNGPQTTGRVYRNLSRPEHGIRRDNNVQITMRDGTILLADILRPDAPGTFPALLAAAPYPRQVQDLGAPVGVVEAGASDFWVPRGYVHVIVNLRGTGGSGGEWGFFDERERHDLYDLVEWIAAQPWCDGEVGMIGISYYAMTQLEAASQQPPHLKAVFPLDVTVDAYEAANHNGLVNAGFMIPWLKTLGVLAGRSDRFFRSVPFRLLRKLFAVPAVHRRFARTGGAAAIRGLRLISRFRYADQPWNGLLRAITVDHPTHDDWWDERDLRLRLGGVRIPVYLGSEWTNVPLHLPGLFEAWRALDGNPNVRMSVLGPHGLPWPWESMHIEALAWYDHWLKGRDTGILDGPPIRYWLPGAQEWRTADEWPPPGRQIALHLNQDGFLDEPERDGARAYDTATPGLTWQTAPLDDPLDMVGELELDLTATATAPDTAWIALLQDVAPDGTVTDVTAGWLRASMRELDEAAGSDGRPVLTRRTEKPVPLGEPVRYRIPLVPNARRFAHGHRIRLTLSSDDTIAGTRAMMLFTHTPVGLVSTNTVSASSRLLLPIVN